MRLFKWRDKVIKETMQNVYVDLLQREIERLQKQNDQLIATILNPYGQAGSDVERTGFDKDWKPDDAFELMAGTLQEGEDTDGRDKASGTEETS